MAKLQQHDFDRLRSQLDKAHTAQDLLDVASAYSIGLTAQQQERARKSALEDVASAEQRFIADDEQHALAGQLRGIQNGGIRVSSKFVSYVLFYGSIASVVVLFVGEVWRLTPVIAPILGTSAVIALIPTAMILLGYYVTALIGKAERKASNEIIVTKRMKNLSEKYINSETITPDEEKEGRIATMTLRNAQRAGRGYGMVEWTLFVGLHLLAGYHAIEDYNKGTHHNMPLVLAVGASVGLIFLLMIVSKMLVTHIYTTSTKPIVTGIQGFDKEALYEESFARAIKRELIGKASAQVEVEATPSANPTQAGRVVQMPTTPAKVSN
jgi:hypothetical protein